MNASAITQPSVAVSQRSVSQALKVPWLSLAGLAASVAIATGIYWDISWHETIGRDTFWTPAHLLTQLGAVIGGLASSFVIFRTTLGKDATARQSSVNVLGFRAPLGAFILAWGAVAMVTSAPFDNWWHNAYGLDVKIVSPPHMLLALGIFGINWGGIFLTVAGMNRAEGVARKRLEYILLATGGFVLIQSMILKLEQSQRAFQHSAISYLVISVGLLLLVEAMARVTGNRWARTIVTGIYMAFGMLMLWILPLFPASPKLGPVYENITHMVPLPFPLLLVIPAFILDLVMPRMKDAPRWQQALVGGVVFLAILIAVQWPFATFLMSPAANNWFFHNNNFPYFDVPTSPNVRHVFANWEATPAWFWRNMGLAFVASVLSMWVGIVFGNWLRRVQR
jgi:hypothetical protein